MTTPHRAAGGLMPTEGPAGPERITDVRLLRDDAPTHPAARSGPAPLRHLLERKVWQQLESDHQLQVDDLTADHRCRRAEKRFHPVEDFMFTYYPFRPSQLRRWHPGAGVGLWDAPERAEWRFHRTVAVPGSHRVAVTADSGQFSAAHGRTVAFIETLLGTTATAAPQFGCFGLHEWAMVFQVDDRRHESWPLRLGRDATDDVVRKHQIRCSHFDAFRFFTPAARALNLLSPDLDSRDRMEQPGCLHASMDLYKWAFRLTPLCSSALVLDCFRLARQIRQVDLRASPYDLTELGYRPIPIETADGKAEYVAAQRDFSRRGQEIRARILGELQLVFGSESGESTSVLPSQADPPRHRNRPGPSRGSSGARQQNSR